MRQNTARISIRLNRMTDLVEIEQLRANRSRQDQTMYEVQGVRASTAAMPSRCCELVFPSKSCSLWAHIENRQCNVCGQLDDHVAKNCPHKQCKRCGEKGHEASRCPSLLRRGGGGCDRCGRRTHVSTACPTIWRRYVKLPHDERPPKRAIVYACYNCGSTSLNNGHFG